MAATGALTLPPSTFSGVENHKSPQFSHLHLAFRHSNCKRSGFLTASPFLSIRERNGSRASYVLDCRLSSPSSTSPNSPSKKLYVSGLSFRTTEEGLRSAFNAYGHFTEVNLVMDKIAKRPRGFAFLRYATEEESQNAIKGMHAKFLDGRVIFDEVAKPRSELRQGFNQTPRNKNHQNYTAKLECAQQDFCWRSTCCRFNQELFTLKKWHNRSLSAVLREWSIHRRQSTKLKKKKNTTKTMQIQMQIQVQWLGLNFH